MWLSASIAQEKGNAVSEEGLITRAEGGTVRAGNANLGGNISIFSPYGFDSLPPKNSCALLIPCKSGAVCGGVKSNCRNLECGEVRIHSLGGAEIMLKNNGNVLINGCVTVTPDGEIFAKDFIKEE